MLGADFYETDTERSALLAEGRVPIGIGENTKIKYKLQLSISFQVLAFLPLAVISHCSFFLYICRECIIDKNARIGKNVVIANSEVQFFTLHSSVAHEDWSLSLA